MEAHWNFANRITFLCFFVEIFLTLLHHGHAKPETPLTNVNLAPFWQWRSAYLCLQNESDICSAKDVLTLGGVVDVNQTEVVDYCWKGCANHTLNVLNCIHMVKRDFWFANRLTVPELSDIINSGCANNRNSKGSIIIAKKRSIIDHLPLTWLTNMPVNIISWNVAADFSTANITANAAIRTYGNLLSPSALSLATLAISTFLIM